MYHTLHKTNNLFNLKITNKLNNVAKMYRIGGELNSVVC